MVSYIYKWCVLHDYDSIMAAIDHPSNQLSEHSISGDLHLETIVAINEWDMYIQWMGHG
jgi:hypothetical protein